MVKTMTNALKTYVRVLKKAVFMNNVCVTVDPGICGFSCSIRARRDDKKRALLEISDSECEQIQRLSEILKEITLQEIFLPLTRNPVFISAGQVGCHTACPVPVAVVKAVEVALGMAVPREVRIKFES